MGSHYRKLALKRTYDLPFFIYSFDVIVLSVLYGCPTFELDDGLKCKLALQAVRTLYSNFL